MKVSVMARNKPLQWERLARNCTQADFDLPRCVWNKEDVGDNWIDLKRTVEFASDLQRNLVWCIGVIATNVLVEHSANETNKSSTNELARELVKRSLFIWSTLMATGCCERLCPTGVRTRLALHGAICSRLDSLLKYSVYSVSHTLLWTATV